jgi:ubiquinone/menaquinone biosynthesis C-methylase UbiE
MDNFNFKAHWENVYNNKKINEVSWYQPKPKTSLDIFRSFNLPKTAKVIDVGGGDSFFVDYLLDLNYRDITVLDISESAIKRAKLRLGKRANGVKWIVANSSCFQPTETYDFWHDRAAFHFLTKKDEIENYLATAHENINQSGILVLGTFSEQGPKKCSGIDIKQYSESTMTEKLKLYFKKIACLNVEHKTPFNTIQNFIFCTFKKA